MPDRSENATIRLTRRHLLKATGGTVAVTVLGVPGGPAISGDQYVTGPTRPAGAKPGLATQRIEGLAKVTGQKVFARDFRARDMQGWPDHEWHACFLRALRTDRAFEDVDLSALPVEARPTRVILGDRLSAGLSKVRVSLSRDLEIDERIKAARVKSATVKGTDDRQFDLPPDYVFDLIVKPGQVPDYLGQAVALLLFDSLAAYRAARKALDFNDAAFQRYGPETAREPAPQMVFSPQTTYVKYGNSFSYAQADPNTYMDAVPEYRDKIQKALDADPNLIRQDFTADMQAMDPMFMEPEAGLVWIDNATETMNLVLGTQSPDGDIASILSMYDSADAPAKLSAVTLTSCYPGGGFGGRDSSPFSLMLALAGGYARGNPVRLAYDRFEQFRVGLKRHAATLSGSLAAAPDMRLQAVDMTLTFDGGGRRNLSPYVAGLAALCAGGAYRLPMANIHAEAIHTPNISGGSQRGFGGPQAFFAFETALDDLAAAQDWDPLELRRANLIRQGDTTVVGGPVDQSLRLEEMLDITASHPLWSERASIKADYAARGLTYGTGLALSMQAYGTSGDGMVAAVRIERDGRLSVLSDAVDMGNGSATTLGVVIGPILGANATSVHMGEYKLFGQTGLTTEGDNPQWDNPRWTRKSVGSSSACLTGLHQVHTVQQTADALFRGPILAAAAAIWGMPPLPPSDVAWSDGALTLKAGRAEPLSLAKLAEAIYAKGLPCGALGHAYFQGTWAEADYDTPGGPIRLALDGLSYYRPAQQDPEFVKRTGTVGPEADTKRYSRYVWAPCVNVVGLTVDTTTGRVQVENVLSVLNAGHIHVPQLVSGQSQGGVGMAIGYTLLEDMPPGLDGPANGMWNLNRYHVPRAQDVPLGRTYVAGSRAQELITLDSTDKEKRVGRGIAEAVMCSVPPAISNALRDAVGRRFTSLPITPAKILEGLNR